MAHAITQNKTMHNNTPITVGRFRVSPMTKQDSDGGFAASVSIHSGRGTSTTTRIMRFKPSFTSQTAALHYASTEGVAWALQH
ncbi:hypothetical protein [Zoogloea sp.]|uniref:hypothetical protein n=1 Tax=Zoogloea sp. TaxID=49181 RepID=UPI0035B08D96